MKGFSIVATALSLPFLATAQTWSPCNPLEKKCDPKSGLNQAHYSVDFRTEGLKDWITTGTKDKAAPPLSKDTGAALVVHNNETAPTIESPFYIFFGIATFRFRASPGIGLISSGLLLSDTLDEIDYENLGSHPTESQTNFFGKGNTTTYDRQISFPTKSDNQKNFHDYKIDWDPDRIIWSIDGKELRTVFRTDSKALGGKNYPQTPCKIKAGNWPVSSKDEGTVEWAGGNVTWSEAPFTMYLESIQIFNRNPAKHYIYKDRTGDSDSIVPTNATDIVNTSEPSSSSTAKNTNISSNNSSSTGTGTLAGSTGFITSGASTIDFHPESWKNIGNIFLAYLVAGAFFLL